MITQSGQELLSKRLENLKELEQLCTAGPDNVLGNACFFRSNPNHIGAWIKEEQVLEVRCCVRLCQRASVLCDCMGQASHLLPWLQPLHRICRHVSTGHVCPGL